MKDPTRLRDQTSSANALKGALALLEGQTASADVLEQIEQRLHSLPARSAPLHAAGGLKLFGIGAGVLLLAAAGLFGLRQRQAARLPETRFKDMHVDQAAAPPAQSARRAPTPEASPDHVSPTQPLSVTSPPAGKAPVSLPAPRAALPPTAASAVASQTAGSQRAAAARIGRDAFAQASPQTSRPASHMGQDAVAQVAPEKAAAPRMEEDEVARAATEKPQRMRQGVVAKAAPQEPQDEAGLLFRAKAAEQRDPALTLRLLELHARYFPQGKYLEERAALAIRAHQRLGQHALAAELSQQFRTRFPRSIYLRTLPP